LRAQAQTFSAVLQGPRSTSVLEQSSLEELVATVELRKEQYAEEVGEHELVEGPTLVSTESVCKAEQVASEQREFVSIPRRPLWAEGMTTERLAVLESEAFTEWRRELASTAQEQGLHLTPYERNLDFWRQLWRTVERSDLLVQILDARDPDFYHCRDLGRYVEEVDKRKRVMLLVNKADFLSADERRQWAEHYATNNVDVLFFSALHELTKQAKLSSTGATKDQVDDAAAVPVPGLDDDLDADGGDAAAKGDEAANSAEMISAKAEEPSDAEDDTTAPPLGILSDADVDVIDCNNLLDELISRLPAASAAQAEGANGVLRRGTVGFVGYPNVGKSTVINALVGAKKVGMSSRPGKTKHIQTLELPSVGITLCDCPGLVFPSVVATRAHLVVNNTVPIDDLTEVWEPIRLIVEKIGFQQILERYRCAKFVKDARSRSGDHVLNDFHAFLAAFAVSRNHTLRIGVPDENWAARKVLNDYVRGTLLHCELPPRPSNADAPAGEPARAAGCERESPPEAEPAEEDGDEFDDLKGFVGNDLAGAKMTKRKMRYMNKQLMKGAPIKAQVRARALG